MPTLQPGLEHPPVHFAVAISALDRVGTRRATVRCRQPEVSIAAGHPPTPLWLAPIWRVYPYGGCSEERLRKVAGFYSLRIGLKFVKFVCQISERLSYEAEGV